MRRFALAAMFVAAAMPAGARLKKVHTIPAPDPCTQADDRAAFDVISLKSELTVTALACHEQDRYNAFMRTYQPAVVAADHDLNSYFRRVYGRRAQTEHDEYITNLASAEEQDGIKSGTAFCAAFDQMFDEVMSLHDATELADFSRSQALEQPLSTTACAAVPAVEHKVKHHYVRKKSA